MDIIKQHPVIFSVIVFLAFIGYIHTLYKFYNRRK